MTQASVAEVVGALRHRYLRARRGDKTLILNESVALTEYRRKAAFCVLRIGRRPQVSDRPGRVWKVARADRQSSGLTVVG